MPTSLIVTIMELSGWSEKGFENAINIPVTEPNITEMRVLF
jgi:hypothetical protein